MGEAAQKEAHDDRQDKSLTSLSQGDDLARAKAARALGKSKDPQAVAPLIIALLSLVGLVSALAGDGARFH